MTCGSASEVCPIKSGRVRSIDARGASRSPSDGMRAKSVRFASRDSRTIQRIGRDAGNCVAQTERGAFRSSSLGDKLSRSVFRLGRASRPLRARHICRATTLLWLKSGRVRKDKRRGKSAAAEKWLKRQLEFRDEQKIIGSIRVA